MPAGRGAQRAAIGERILRTPAWLVAAVLAGLYLAIDPPSADLAAQVYRAGYFGREGFALWDGSWYAGHHMPGYSVLFPPLAALLGPRLVGALAAVASAVLFERIADEHFRRTEGRLGVLWFAAATSLNLITGRLAFGFGVMVGLAALLAITHRRDALALGLAVATTLASPVAGVFLAMGAAAWWLAARDHRALTLGAAALVPAVLLAIAFPEGGVEPFVASSFWPALVTIGLVLVVLPVEERVLRTGCGLYALGCIAAFVVSSPVGGNVVRLGALFGGPLLACLIWRRRPLVLALLALPLLYWQWNAPVRDWVRAHGDPSIHAGYYRPLLAFLRTRDNAGPFRLEIPFSANHLEAARVAPHFPLARGWERQLDIKYNALFYADHLDAARYRRWLGENAVRFVALPDVPLDASATQEAALLRHGQPWLWPAWRGAHWRVWEVRGAAPMADGAAVTALGPDHFDLRAPTAGTVRVRVRFTPYWAVVRGDGCVARRAGDWTEVRVRHPGTLRVATRFSALRVVSRGPRCSS